MAKEIKFKKKADNLYELYAYSKKYCEWIYINDYKAEEITQIVEQLTDLE